MPSPILDSKQPDLASAKELLARLERCAQAYRSTPRESRPYIAPGPSILAAAVPTIVVDDFQPHDVRRNRLDPATADLWKEFFTEDRLTAETRRLMDVIGVVRA